MIMTKDNEFSSGENQQIELAVMSVIGDRQMQEDCFGYELDNQSVILCVCDGMGGYAGGSVASRLAIETILKSYYTAEDMAAMLTDLTTKANAAVSDFQSAVRDAGNAGSTLVAVSIRDNMLHWSAVGDSRLYIWRKEELIQTTTDHNYHTVLTEKRNAGIITEDEFVQGQARGDALVNYLGISVLSLIDYNKEPLKLKSGDQVIICTDGLYRVLSDEEITSILNLNNDVTSALQIIELAVRKKTKENNLRRDNMTVSLIKIK